MKMKVSNIIWGTLLILLGAAAFAQQMDWFDERQLESLSIIFAGLGIVAFAGYLASGWRKWGLLFPSTIFIGIALVFWLEERADFSDEVEGGLFMVLISIPFWIGFLVDRRRNWWALIPGWSLLVVGIIINLGRAEDDPLIATLVLLAIALPFYVRFITARRHLWALVVGAVLSIVAFIPLLESQAAEEFIGAFFMAGIALVFFVVYLRHRDAWWALLTAGTTLSLALVILLDALTMTRSVKDRLIPAVLFGGLALTFLALYRQRAKLRTGWSLYPAAGCIAAGAVFAIFGQATETFWALALIAMGLAIIAGVFRTRAKRPALEPPADTPGDKI